MNNTVFIAISSAEYLGYYDQLYKSLEEYEDLDQILYLIGHTSNKLRYENVVNITDWKTIYPDKLTHICSLRARVVLDAFERGYDKVVFCGAKVEFFGYPSVLLNYLETHSSVVTPHILEPLPEDGKFPSNASVSFTGHISTDLVGFRQTDETVKFLKWQDETMKTKCATTQYTYLDQSWLNFLPFFVEDVLILKDVGYNVAYWNMFQRNLEMCQRCKVRGDKRHYLLTDSFTGADKDLIAFQYSGLDLNDCKRISTHQNRWTASGDILEFLQNYADRVKSYNINSRVEEQLK